MVVALVVSLVLPPSFRSDAVFFAVQPPGPGQVQNYQVSEGFLRAQLDILESDTAENLVVERIGSPAPASFGRLNRESPALRITGKGDSAERAVEVAATYLEVFAEVQAAEELGRNLQTQQFLGARLAEVEEELAALKLVAAGSPLGPDPEVSSQLADLDTQRRQYVFDLRALQDQAALLPQGRIQVVDAPGLPTEPSRAALAPTVILGLLLGLGAGGALVLARRRLSERFEAAEELRVAAGVPVLGVIPVDASCAVTGELHITSLTNPPSRVAEAYRTLRTALRFACLERSVATVQVTSARPGDGKSTTVANLAAVLASTGLRVLMVDLDLRRPQLHRFVGCANDRGFTSLLLGEHRLDEVVHPVCDGLDLLSAGPQPGNPAEVLSSESARVALWRAAVGYDVVVVDSPPVLAVSDPMVIAEMVDATLLVARSGRVSTGELASTVELLSRVDARLVGSVANGVSGQPGYYGMAYRAGSGLGPFISGLRPGGWGGGADPEAERPVPADGGWPRALDVAVVGALSDAGRAGSPGRTYSLSGSPVAGDASDPVSGRPRRRTLVQRLRDPLRRRPPRHPDRPARGSRGSSGAGGDDLAPSDGGNSR